MRVNVSAYNEAGELVGVIAQGLVYSSSINEFLFADGAGSINDVNSSIAIVFPDDGARGPVTLTWSGTDPNGSPLSNGDYIIRVESVDSVGVATVITGTASILRSESSATVRIYNEAGEIVFSRQYSAISLQQSEVQILGNVVDPSLPDGSPGSTLDIRLGTLDVLWSGRDLNGRVLANGEYLVEISLQNGSETSVISDTITVLNSLHPPDDDIQLNPNPIVGNAPLDIRVQAGASGGVIRVFTVSGELVARFRFLGDNASWDLRDRQGSLVTAGLYLVLAEIELPEGSNAKAVTRLVVLR